MKIQLSFFIVMFFIISCQSQKTKATNEQVSNNSELKVTFKNENSEEQ